jgi:predicted amidohydrolase YtcJ
MDAGKPEVRALAVRGDTIVAAGTDAEIQPYVGSNTKTIDLGGMLAVPGFIESHGHFTILGESKLALDLTRAANWDEIVAMVAEKAKTAKPGEYIIGRGWHQEKWNRRPAPNVEGFPVHDAVSKAAPNNPVLLYHASGHAIYGNAKAMELAGITRHTPNPPGGDILHDEAGNPTGVFRNIAMDLLTRALEDMQSKRTPAQVEADERRIIELATEECLSKGVTTFYDAGQPFSTVDMYKKLADEGSLRIRLWVMLQETNKSLDENVARYRIIDHGNRHLTVRAIKRLADGALGSRTAWLLQPYADLKTSTGLNIYTTADLAETARIALAHDLQLCTHAIGDRANREVLNVYETVFKAHPDKKDLRWRIEHAQHIAAADIPRFGALGVIAAMQGIHATSDAPYVLARLGPQRAEEGAYVWQKLMKSGAIVCNGTDVPIEDVDPIACFHSSVSRKLKDGSVFYSNQRMSREEALKSYTLNAAYSGFEENSKGSLKPGKLADITVLSKDILTIPEDEIPTAVVKYTIIGGKVMYSQNFRRSE